MMWKATVTPITTSYNSSMQKSISKHTTLPLKVSTAQRESCPGGGLRSFALHLVLYLFYFFYRLNL